MDMDERWVNRSAPTMLETFHRLMEFHWPSVRTGSVLGATWSSAVRSHAMTGSPTSETWLSHSE